jgi:AcrR family transcriptional regulator
MSISDRKQRETELLRERVLETAEGIIAAEGVGNVTMRRIASSIDYAPTVLYRLFANKDDLMDHLIARGYGGVRDRYEEVMSHDLAPLERLEAVLTEYCSYALEHPNHYQMWFATGAISREDGSLKMQHGRLEFDVFQAWLDCIDACVETGLFPGRDSFRVFQILWSRMHGVISLRLQHENFPWPPAEKHLEDVLDLAGLACE